MWLYQGDVWVHSLLIFISDYGGWQWRLWWGWWRWWWWRWWWWWWRLHIHRSWYNSKVNGKVSRFWEAMMTLKHCNLLHHCGSPPSKMPSATTNFLFLITRDKSSDCIYTLFYMFCSNIAIMWLHAFNSCPIWQIWRAGQRKYSLDSISFLKMYGSRRAGWYFSKHNCLSAFAQEEVAYAVAPAVWAAACWLQGKEGGGLLSPHHTPVIVAAGAPDTGKSMHQALLLARCQS